MPDIDGMLNGLLKLLLPAAVIAAGTFAVYAVLDRMAADSRAAEWHALLVRKAELERNALTPGSALACLDGDAGETVQNACEKAVFADARSVAAALHYTGARLSLIKDAFDLARRSGGDVPAGLAGERRAIELDRYGVAAHVLTHRDACTAEQCAAFAMLSDTGALKANIKAAVFEQYVSRYAPEWNKVAPAPAQPAPSAAVPSMPEAPVAGALPPLAPTGKPVDSRWDFPSAASIPPVSIMNPEPKRPPSASTPAQPGAPAPAGAAATPPAVRVPPKRPQGEATPPPPAR